MAGRLRKGPVGHASAVARVEVVVDAFDGRGTSRSVTVSKCFVYGRTGVVARFVVIRVLTCPSHIGKDVDGQGLARSTEKRPQPTKTYTLRAGLGSRPQHGGSPWPLGGQETTHEYLQSGFPGLCLSGADE